MKKQIEELKRVFIENGKLFIPSPDAEIDEEHQTASFLFLGKHEGKEMLFDTFMMTLIQDYRMNIMEQAEEKLLNLYPELEGVDYEELTEEQKDEYDNLFESIYRSDLIKVQENLSIQPSEKGEHMEIDVIIDVRKINDKVIDNFIRTFNAKAFEVNENLRSFDLDDEL